MIVIKLGGSHYQSDDLASCLNALEKLSQQQPIIIVPGGGPFADQVREAQKKFKYSDTVAHHMAILAMTQFGLIISSLNANIVEFSNPRKSTNNTPLSIWLPDEQLVMEPGLAHSWSVTSDSLALWLAQQLKADQLILIKQQTNSKPLSITQLSQQDVIDPAFPDLYRQSPVPTSVLSIKDILQSEPFPFTTPLNL